MAIFTDNTVTKQKIGYINKKTIKKKKGNRG
jgi:hypothetical protein